MTKKRPQKKQRCPETGKGHARCVLFAKHKGVHLDQNGRAWVNVRTK